MSKPSVVPQFDSNQTHVTATTNSHKTDGWATNEVIPSDGLNYWMYWVYQWTKYLNDGDIELDALTLPATNVSIANGANNNLDVGILSSPPPMMVRLTGGGGSASITGILSAATEGRTIALLNVTNSDIGLVVESSSSTGTNRLLINDTAANASVRMPPLGSLLLRYDIAGVGGRWVMLASSFPIDSSPLEVMVIPASEADSLDDTNTSSNDLASGQLTYPIKLPVGCTLRSWKLYLQKTSDNTKTVTASLNDITSATGSSSTVGASPKTTAANNPGHTTLKDTGLSQVFAVGHAYTLTASSNAGASTDFADDLEISYTRNFMSAPLSYTP